MERDRDGAGLLVAHDVDDRPVAIEDRDATGASHFTLSHFVGGALQLRVADEQVPDDRAEALGVRRRPLARDRWG